VLLSNSPKARETQAVVVVGHDGSPTVEHVTVSTVGGEVEAQDNHRQERIACGCGEACQTPAKANLVRAS
jgi:hypothetical protein